MQKILVIDDDPMVRFTLSKILGRNGYEVHLAGDGQEGVQTYRTLQPDLVITDMVMPVQGGLETIQMLRALSPSVKIVAISGGNRLVNKDALGKAADLGAADFIAKPFTPAELLGKVANCLSC
jgi:CheY-like chemotaxis protein